MPSQQEVYSELQKKSLSDEAYQHVLNVWEHFDFTTFQEYMEFYMCLDVVLLQCIFEKFCTSAQANYDHSDLPFLPESFKPNEEMLSDEQKDFLQLLI